MANTGKYKDNLPFICAAGVRHERNFSSGDCLKQYNLDDSVKALKSDFHVPEKEILSIKLPKIDTRSRNPGIYVESKEVLYPPPLTRYRQLINDLKETTYKSYWNKNLGAVPDDIPAFPEGINIKNMTFGDAYNYDTSVKDLIQPPKSSHQVLWEGQVNHDTYKKIYGSYNPGERIDRGYKSPPFNSTQAFGKIYGYDKRGLKTKCCMEWYDTSPLAITSKIYGKWTEKTKDKVGKCHEPNKEIMQEILPEGHTFGVPYRRDDHGVEDLLRGDSSQIPTIPRDVRGWLVSFNRLKMAIKKKITPIFDYNILLEKMIALDEDESGYITFDNLLKLMRCNEIFFNIENVKKLMQHLGIMVGDGLDYRKFLDSLKGHLEIPGNDCFVSTYQAKCCHSNIPEENLSDVDHPSQKSEEEKPETIISNKHCGQCDFTDVKMCLQPSIFSQYSLSNRDLFRPRDEAVIRSLFEKIGYKLSDENFAKIWKMGQEEDSSDLVCVQTFRDLLDKFFPLGKKLNIDGIR